MANKVTPNKDAPYAEFGERLTKLRKRDNMSRAELGEICGVAPSTIVNYERGIRIPYADTAVRMAEHFDISVPELLGMEDPEAEMLAAELADTTGTAMSKRAQARAKKSLREVQSVLGAGGLSKEDRMGYILTMQRLMLDASVEAADTYTPFSLRGDDWEEKKAMRHANADNARQIIEERAKDYEDSNS